MRIVRILVAIAAFGPTAASAQDEKLRDFCPDRPGLGTPACTMDPGHFAIELGLADWTVDRAPASRTDSVEAGQLLLRLGLTDSLEAQLAWTAFGHVRIRSAGSVGRDSGIGDVALALRQNLVNPEGSGFSLALMPFANLPAGGSAIGAGDWSAGVIVPLSYDLGKGMQLGLTGQLEAAADPDRHGRHLAYGAVAGLSVPLSDALGAAFEIAATRDEDPAGHETEWLAGLSAGWMAKDDLQLDAGVNFGLHRAPDVQLYVGVSRRF